MCILKSLPNISKWNTSNVINFDNMFDDCHNLKSKPKFYKEVIRSKSMLIKNPSSKYNKEKKK